MELKEVNKLGKAKCACCGYYTITAIAETCPICNWEENIYQEENQDDDDAPNYISLKEAKKNFEKFGAKNINSIKLVRPALRDEHP